MTRTRREALKTLLLPAVGGLGVTGCAGGQPTVQVAVVWTGWELRQFDRVMAAFSKLYQVGYQIQSMGDDTSAFLSNEVAAAAQPDVVLTPRPGLITRNGAGPVPLDWPADDAASWRPLLAAPGGRQYGAWFKAAFESMVWHADDLPVQAGGWTWDQWVAQCRALAAAGRPPLAMGAADGWVLAGWFANVLLTLDPATYLALSAWYTGGRPAGPPPRWDHPSVSRALLRLAEVWSIPGAFPGGAERALATQFDQSVLDVFAAREAAMLVGADYLWPIITGPAEFPAHRVRWFRFPSNPGENPPAVVSGDAALLFARPGRGQAARQLMSWLASPAAGRIWAGAGGFLSINDQVTVRDYPYPTTMNPGELVRGVQQAAAAYNLTDLLTGPLGGADGKGNWKIFTDFFTAVAVYGTPAAAAAAAAISALNGGAGGS